MWQFQPRTYIPWYLQLVSPLIAVFLTILLGMGLFSFLGKDPFHAMQVFFCFASIGSTTNRAPACPKSPNTSSCRRR